MALARALAPRPRLLLLDEPLSALDRSLREQTRQELLRVQRETGTTFVLVTHDQDEALAMATRIGLLHQGDVLAGLVEMILEPDHLMIENVAVLPAHQGQGLGRFLVAHAEAVARAEGYGQVRLYTNQRFAENIHLYRRLGYEVEREETWTGGVIVHMRKPLEG